jgi:hypothetical protein
MTVSLRFPNCYCRSGLVDLKLRMKGAVKGSSSTSPSSKAAPTFKVPAGFVAQMLTELF